MLQIFCEHNSKTSKSIMVKIEHDKYFAKYKHHIYSQTDIMSPSKGTVEYGHILKVVA
jgi:hypothetical protein